MAHGYARPHHMLQTEEEVLDIVEDDPSTSTREIARQTKMLAPNSKEKFSDGGTLNTSGNPINST
ncbi:hypothetical protein NQ317_007952 [Molorchus minor]|uniref:HTH psq-type domain-containing protein n=1 Tax=Molorchus minor TaxID=1323400 RepID=A0ABQ9K180_9CUCU|nr:hypothetical protein NQ317_007952 [Molorchus minor]